MQVSFRNRTVRLQRYPATTNRSLLPFAAADELLLEWYDEQAPPTARVTVAHDRFGSLAACLGAPLQFIGLFHSQETALALNAGEDVLAKLTVTGLLEEWEPSDYYLLRLPKSLDLLELYLLKAALSARPGARLAVGFMTRHFSPRLLEIAGRYAENVRQSRARKKARLLFLEGLRAPDGATIPIRELHYEGRSYRQFPGVFSGAHIDYATQLLLRHWQDLDLADLPESATILDLACGNGIIGAELLGRYTKASLVATDDSALAVASARLNLPEQRVRVLYHHRLDFLADNAIDLVVTNPPFHFGYENNIEVSLDLFRQSRRVLRPGGRLIIVANRHLNYGTHLQKLFPRVDRVMETHKFVIYVCQ